MRENVQPQTLLRNFISMAIGNYGAIVVSVLLSLYLTRSLGAERFGKLALLLMAVQVSGCFLSNWTLPALVKFGSQEYAKESTIAGTFWARAALLMPWIAFAALGLLLAQEQAAEYLAVPVWAVWMVFGYYLLSMLLLTLGSVFQARQQMGAYAVTLFLEKASVLAAVVLLPNAYAHDPVVILICYAMGSLLVCAWSVHALGLRTFRPVYCDGQALAALWKFSIPLILSTWIGVFNSQWIDYVIIKHYRPLTDLGQYSLVIQMAGVVQQVTIILSSLLLPHFSVQVLGDRLAEIKTAVEGVITYGFLAFSILLCGLVLLSGIGIPLLFGHEFRGAVTPFVVISIASMGLALYNAFLPLVTAYGWTWMLTAILLACSCINVALDLVLVPRLGISGAAIATLCSYLTAAASILAVVEARLHIPVLHLGWFLVPVATVAGCSLIFEGWSYYLMGTVGMAVSLAVVIMAVGLADGDHFGDTAGGIWNSFKSMIAK